MHHLALGPIFPYLEAGPWKFGPFTIHMFGLMVGLGILFGTWIMLRRARQVGLSEYHMGQMVQYGIVGLFVGAHLYSVLLYFPERVLSDPLLLLRFWDGIASTGGLIGLLVVVWWYTRKNGLDFLAYLDNILWGGLHGWVFGRLGCSFAHDHPGTFTDFWFSVKWPMDDPDRVFYAGGNLPGRHDLGLYEFLFTLVMLAVLYVTNRKGQRFRGFTTALIFVMYAPTRFFLDYLRVLDARYWGLTPAQWAMIPMFATGVFMFFHLPSQEKEKSPDDMADDVSKTDNEEEADAPQEQSAGDVGTPQPEFSAEEGTPSGDSATDSGDGTSQ